MRAEFSIGTVKSTDYGMVLTEIHTWDTPVANVSFEPIAGRLDTLTVIDGRMENLDLSFVAWIGDEFKMRYTAFRNAVLSLKGYQRIFSSTDLRCYRMGLVHQSVKGSPLVNGKSGYVEIHITCKPQRFLLTGQDPVDLAAPGVITNPTAFPALPLIRVTGSGAGTLSVAGCTVELLAIDGHVWLDSETMEAYRQDGSRAPENKNGTVVAPEYPQLKPGGNQITWTGGVTAVEITPRWWEL